MMNSEYEVYLEAVEEMEDRIIDDNQFPVVDGGIKTVLTIILEFIKLILNYLRVGIINA